MTSDNLRTPIEEARDSGEMNPRAIPVSNSGHSDPRGQKALDQKTEQA